MKSKYAIKMNLDQSPLDNLSGTHLTFFFKPDVCHPFSVVSDKCRDFLIGLHIVGVVGVVVHQWLSSRVSLASKILSLFVLVLIKAFLKPSLHRRMKNLIVLVVSFARIDFQLFFVSQCLQYMSSIYLRPIPEQLINEFTFNTLFCLLSEFFFHLKPDNWFDSEIDVSVRQV